MAGHRELYERPPFPGFGDAKKLAAWIERVRIIAFFQGARHDAISKAEAEAFVEAAQRLQALLEEARRVVEPFAKAQIGSADLTRSAPEPSDETEVCFLAGLSFGHFRAARSFIDKLDGADGR